MTEIPQIGDNTKQLRSLIDRIVRLEEEKKNFASDIKDLYTEAKSRGYSPQAIRVLVKHELEDDAKRAKRIELEETVEALKASLGDFANSPLGEAAVSRVA